MSVDNSSPDMLTPTTPLSELGPQERRERILHGIEIGYELVDGAVLDIQSIYDAMAGGSVVAPEVVDEAIARTKRIDAFKDMLDSVSASMVESSNSSEDSANQKS